MLLHEFTGASKDFGYEQQHREQKNDLKSVGFNAELGSQREVQSGLRLPRLARRRSLPDDPITGGGETAFSLAGKVPSTCLQTVPNPTPANPAATTCVNATNFWTQTFEFNNGLPIAGRTLFPNQVDAYAGANGDPDYDFDAGSIGSQVLRIGYQDQITDIKQGRLDGKYTFESGSSFGFGVETRSMESRQRSSGGYLALGDWGVGDVGNVPDMVALLTPFSLTGAFDDFNPVGAPTGGWKAQCQRCSASGRSAMHGYGNWSEASAAGWPAGLQPGLQHQQHACRKTRRRCMRRWRSSSRSAACRPTWSSVRDTKRPTSTSINSILVPTAVIWQDDNDFQVERPGVGNETLVTGDGSYHNLLPNLDFDIASDRCDEGAASRTARRSRARGTAAVGRCRSRARPGGSTLQRLHAAAARRTTRPAAARVGQLRPVARVLLLGQGLRVRWLRSRRTSRTSSATRSSTATCTASATRRAVRARRRPVGT